MNYTEDRFSSRESPTAPHRHRWGAVAYTAPMNPLKAIAIAVWSAVLLGATLLGAVWVAQAPQREAQARYDDTYAYINERWAEGDEEARIGICWTWGTSRQTALIELRKLLADRENYSEDALIDFLTKECG